MVLELYCMDLKNGRDENWLDVSCRSHDLTMLTSTRSGLLRKTLSMAMRKEIQKKKKQ